MPFYDASNPAGDLFGWRSELGARVRDSLARKSLPISAKLGAIARRLEGAVSLGKMKAALSELMAYLRHEERAQPPQRDALHDRIAEYRKKESIENYGAYLFTVDIRL
jgi:hypothetical protein